MINNSFKEDLYKYITGIVQTNNHKMIAINGVPDHIHLFVVLRKRQSIADLMQDVKGSSSKWINAHKKTNFHFEWQEGFGGFSYSKSSLKNVINYIECQEEHHRKKTFREEYLEFLEEFEIPYEEKYLFQELI